MAKILEQKRTFKKVKAQKWDIIWVKNPLYDSKEMAEHEKLGYAYYHEEYIEKEVPVSYFRTSSHIEYRIECEYCKGTNGWVKRKDARFCCGSCRNMARKENKKDSN